ncbi:hypothetical protein QBC36DRAFT_293873 [Triangularia setosa]|uniref:Uncharacterized protein n=1 Tax=Triangularia setosa TaxID=2587417 RepID=A0AAN7A3Q5_9PEZI|nr:hypothetical protein QBC36DRAFT_293873 [Podospora setosa]
MLLTQSSGREIAFDPAHAQFAPPLMYCDLPQEVPGQIFQNRWCSDLDSTNLVLAEVVTQKITSLLTLRYGRVKKALKLGNKEFLPLRKAVAASMKRGLIFTTKEIDGKILEHMFMTSRNPVSSGKDEFCSIASMIWLQKAKYNMDRITRGHVPRCFNNMTLLKIGKKRFEPKVNLRL